MNRATDRQTDRQREKRYAAAPNRSAALSQRSHRRGRRGLRLGRSADSAAIVSAAIASTTVLRLGSSAVSAAI